MQLGGYEPCSLCDYPRLVAGVVFTQGCNFRCPFCHNGALLPATGAPQGRPGAEEVLDRLRRRRGRLQGVVIGGGEPTLQEDLPAFLERVRSLGFLIKLDTNGSRPAMLRTLLQAGLVDYVAVDIKAPWRKYDILSGLPRASVDAVVAAVRESAALVAQSGLEHEFRTTIVPALLSEDDITVIRGAVPPGSPHRVQAFRAAQALDPRLRAPRTPEHLSPRQERQGLKALSHLHGAGGESRTPMGLPTRS